MALNLSKLKALFGKLAPYADDVAKGIVNYGDDAARAVANYGDDVVRGIANSADDAVGAAGKIDNLLPITTEFDEVLTRQLPVDVFHDAPDVTARRDLWGARDLQPPPDNRVLKDMFASYNPKFEGTVNFPDGFASPDDFARYYDSLELGYVPSNFQIDSLSEMFGDTVDTANWNDFWQSHYSTGPYADEGPLEAFFREQAKLPKGISKRQPLRTTEEFFSNPMFEDDWWL